MPHPSLHDGKPHLHARSARAVRRRSLPIAGVALQVALWSGFALPASGHDAPSGWSYPYACCSMNDCRPVATKAISERPEGFVINVTGEVVPYRDTRVRPSPDGEFHWCSVAGGEGGRTICLFVPPRAY